MGVTLNGTSDGLDIAQGPGQGEAYMVKDSSWDPIAFQRHYMDTAALRMQQQRALEQKRHSEIDKWMTDKNPVVKWDVDQQNYFSKRLNDFQNQKIELIKKYNYNPPPDKMGELDREIADIKNDATISNTQYDAYNKAVTEGSKRKEDGQPYYDASSVHGIQFYGHPQDFMGERMVNQAGEETTVADELKKNGYDPKNDYKQNQAAIYQFRARNQNLLNPVADWHFAEREGKLLNEDKIEPTSQVVTGTYNGRKGTQNVTRYTESQINGLGAKLYEENPRKMSQQMQQAVGSQLNEEQYDKFAKKTLIDAGIYAPQEDPKADPVYTPQFQATVNKNPKLAQNLIDKALAIKQHEIWFSNTHPDQVKGFNEFNKVPAGDKSKENTTIATHYADIANQVQQNPNMSPDQVASQFGGKAVVNAGTGQYYVSLPVPPNVKPFVSVPMGSILTFQNGAYRPTLGTGQVPGTVHSNQIQWKKNGVTVTPNTPGASVYGQITYNPVQVDPNNEDDLAKSYVLFANANPNTSVTKEVYKKMLEDGKKVGKDFKVEYDLNDPVQRTYYDQALGGTSVSQTAFNKESKAAGSKSAPVKQPTSTSAKTGKTVPLSKIKSLVGAKGYEGYSEQELIDYYKGQGYNIK